MKYPNSSGTAQIALHVGKKKKCIMLCLKEEGLNEKKYKTNKSSEITQIADVLHMFACPLRYWDRENKVLIDR